MDPSVERKLMRFEGRAAIVTGAAHGIGEATAHLLAREGASVVLADVHVRGEDVAAAIRETGARASFVQADVGVEGDVHDVVAHAIEQFGRLDVLVNNAAMTLPKGYDDTTQDEWDRVQRVNLGSVYLFLRAATPHLRASGHGAVVNVSSFHANATIERFAAYAASKAGVLGLTRSAALDLAPDGVRVNAVCPGIVETAMWDAWLAEVDDREATVREVNRFQPLGRIGRPDEVARAIAFLASDEASYVTGTALAVDGGVSARLNHV
jgi:NAD(P)-dependent dehydrogenase (short-subunit alcohol dehydrogenase family)